MPLLCFFQLLSLRSISHPYFSSHLTFIARRNPNSAPFAQSHAPHWLLVLALDLLNCFYLLNSIYLVGI